MRKRLFFFLFLSVVLNSCKKEKPNPPCTTTCQNRGTVTSNCGCNCPSGFTGSNCQTRVLTSTTVDLNPNYFRHFCPVWSYGDDDFGGCLAINWSVQLVLRNNDTRIYAKVYALFMEYSSTGNTTAWINPNLESSEILLYTATGDKKIYSMPNNNSYSGVFNPDCDYHGKMNYTNTALNSFLHKIEVIGDTSGPDLPCDGSAERSRFRIYFKSFGVTLVNR